MSLFGFKKSPIHNSLYYRTVQTRDFGSMFFFVEILLGFILIGKAVELTKSKSIPKENIMITFSVDFV